MTSIPPSRPAGTPRPGPGRTYPGREYRARLHVRLWLLCLAAITLAIAWQAWVVPELTVVLLPTSGEGTPWAVQLISALGIGMSTMDVGGTSIPVPGPIVTGLGFIVGIYAIYLLVVLGFLKGTAGPNNYGPDPLQG